MEALLAVYEVNGIAEDSGYEKRCQGIIVKMRRRPVKISRCGTEFNGLFIHHFLLLSVINPTGSADSHCFGLKLLLRPSSLPTVLELVDLPDFD